MQQGDPRCIFCGSRMNLERHHVLGGVANRPLSEKYGLWVWLCHEHHTGKNGAQYVRGKGDELKRAAQIHFEAKYGHEAWMQTFRKNYLDVETTYKTRED
jgi:hypothetical protein